MDLKIFNEYFDIKLLLITMCLIIANIFFQSNNNFILVKKK